MIGMGCDLHKLEKGKKLIIGGVPIESKYGAVAHSDGDVLIHALVDAILGASGMGDIGEHYPDTNPEYHNADSSIFLKETIYCTWCIKIGMGCLGTRVCPIGCQLWIYNKYRNTLRVKTSVITRCIC